jgi:hypothetical protein
VLAHGRQLVVSSGVIDAHNTRERKSATDACAEHHQQKFNNSACAIQPHAIDRAGARSRRFTSRNGNHGATNLAISIGSRRIKWTLHGAANTQKGTTVGPTCAAIVSSKKDCSRQGSRCWRAAHWTWLGYGCRRMRFAQIRANLGMQADMSGKSTSVDRCIASAPLQGITARPVASRQVDGFACPRCRRLAGDGCCRRLCSCSSTVFEALYLVVHVHYERVVMVVVVGVSGE